MKYLFLAVLGFHHFMDFGPVAAGGGFPLVAVCRLLIAVAALVTERGLLGLQASVVVALGLSHCHSWALGHRLSGCGS